MTRPLKVVFMGTPDFAVPSLAALNDDDRFDVVGVVTQPDRPAGRGRQLCPSAVKSYALEHNLPVLQFARLKASDTRQSLAALNPDVAVVAAYGRILPASVLDLPRLGCINVHASLLPRHRGASPIAHALLQGDTTTGVSIMRMDMGLDTGDVYASEAIEILPQDTCGSLTTKLAQLGAKILPGVLLAIAQGGAHPTPQDSSRATYARLLKKEDGELDFQKSASELERQIRAFSPWPGCYAVLNPDLRVQVLAAHTTAGSGRAGEIIQADPKGVVVGCSQGALCLDEIKLPGKRAMKASAWVAGRGVEAGAQFKR